MRTVRAFAVWCSFGALALDASLSSAQVERVPEFGRPLVSVEDSTAIVVNPANLAFMRGGELRWTGLFLNEDTDNPYSGHAIGLGGLIPFLNVGAGLRLDLVDPPNYASYDNYRWLTWALAVPMGRGSALGATIEHSYSDSSLLDDLTGVSLGFTSRWTNWFGLAVVGHNLNRPSNRFYELQPRWEAGVSIRPLSTRTFEIALESAYLRDDELWTPKALVGLDIGPVGRLRGEFSVQDPSSDEQRWQAALSMSINVNAPVGSTELTGGGVTGTLLGPSDVYSPYFSAATRGFRESVGLKPGRYGVKVRIDETPDERDHVALLRSLWALAKESNVDAVALELRAAPAETLAAVEELRDALFELRRAGKRVICHGDSLGTGALFLCSAANRIAVAPSGDIHVTGLHSTQLYLSELLAKLGVKADFVRSGEYKSAPEQLTSRQASPAARENRIDLLQQAELEITTALALGRNLKVPTVRQTLGEGPFLANQALESQLVDAVVFGDEIDDQVDAATGRDTPLLDNELAPLQPDTFRKEGSLALVYVDGEIMDGKSNDFPILGVHTSGAETLTETFEKLRNNRTVKAVVLRVNSPGGSSTASDALWRAVQLTAKEKPVIVSMGGAAASGGYYLASAGTRIFANPSTVTGSIGVFYGKGDVSELLGKIGVDVETYKTHPNADAESWFRPFTDSEREAMSKHVQTLYELFVARVAESRDLTKEQVDAVGKGRVWTGRQAVAAKLADEVGGLRQAIEYARREAHLSDNAPILELPVPERSLLLEAAGFTRAQEQTAASIPLPIRRVLRAVAPVVIHPANKAQTRLELALEPLD